MTYEEINAALHSAIMTLRGSNVYMEIDGGDIQELLDETKAKLEELHEQLEKNAEEIERLEDRIEELEDSL